MAEKKQANRGSVVLGKRAFNKMKEVISNQTLGVAFSEARTLDSQTIALSLTLREMKTLFRLVSDLLDFGPLRQRKMWDETLNDIGWAIDDYAFAKMNNNRKQK